jgi:excisionase family DNA binding protein
MLTDEVYTIEEVAKHLRIPTDVVEKEIASGKLQAMRFAGLLRISEGDLNAFKSGAKTTQVFLEVSARPQDLVKLDTVPNFFHTWPDKKKEKFTDAREGIAEYAGLTYHVKLGFTTRNSAGKVRRRSLVLINRYPSVEFVSAGVDDDNGLMASIIKDRLAKQLPVGADAPHEYADLRTGPYQDIVVGRGAPNGLAVICSSDDVETMVRHALIRYRYRAEREQNKK